MADKSRDRPSTTSSQLSDELMPLARVGLEFLSEAANSERVKERQERRCDIVRQFLLLAAHARLSSTASPPRRRHRRRRRADDGPQRRHPAALGRRPARRSPSRRSSPRIIALLNAGLSRPTISMFTLCPHPRRRAGTATQWAITRRRLSHASSHPHAAPACSARRRCRPLVLTACVRRPGARATPRPPRRPSAAAGLGADRRSAAISSRPWPTAATSAPASRSACCPRPPVASRASWSTSAATSRLATRSPTLDTGQRPDHRPAGAASLAGAEAKLASLQPGPRRRTSPPPKPR